MKAVIPAAGLGTGFLPATKSQPKEMLPVYDKPTLQYLVEEAVASGIDDILIVTGRNKRSIEDHFDKSYELEYALQRAGKDRDLKKIRKITDLADICYVRQKSPKGVGDAIKCSEKHIKDQPFAVLLGHSITKSPIPCTKQLIEANKKYGSTAIALTEVSNKNQNRYRTIRGDMVEEGIYRIAEINERGQNPTDLGVVGRCILTPDIFEKIEETDVGAEGEIHLTDAISKLDTKYGVLFRGESYYIENSLDWLKASISYGLNDAEFKGELVNFMKDHIE